MGRLIYSMLVSLDGYVADARGRFGWATPDDEVHDHVTERVASVGTYLYGRRMYATMVFLGVRAHDRRRRSGRRRLGPA